MQCKAECFPITNQRGCKECLCPLSGNQEPNATAESTTHSLVDVFATGLSTGMEQSCNLLFYWLTHYVNFKFYLQKYLPESQAIIQSHSSKNYCSVLYYVKY